MDTPAGDLQRTRLERRRGLQNHPVRGIIMAKACSAISFLIETWSYLDSVIGIL